MFRVALTILLLSFCFVAVNGQAILHEQQVLERKLKGSNPDTVRVNLLLKLSDCYFLKPTPKTGDLETALAHAHAAEKLSMSLGYVRGQGNAYEQISKILHVKGDKKAAMELALKAIELFKANNYQLELGYAYFDLCGYQTLYGNGLAERIELEQKSLIAFRKSGFRKKEGDILKELADLHNLQQDYQTALSELTEALEIYQSIHYPRLQGVYDLLGFVFVKLGNLDKALNYGLLAVKTAEQLNDTTLQMATICNRVGIVYLNLRNYEQALFYFRRGLAIGEHFNDAPTVLYISANISKCYLQQNKPAESLALLKDVSQKYPTNNITLRVLLTCGFLSTYNDLKQYSNARVYSEQLISLCKQYTAKEYYQFVVYENLIQYFIDTGQNALARKYLAMSDDYAATNHLPDLQSKNYLYWFKLDSLEHNYLLAIAHYQKFKALQDSLLNEAKTRKIEQLRIDYETEQKDQHIRSLAKQNQLQQDQLQQANLVKKLTLGGLISLLAIIGLLIYHSRHRYQSHKRLAEQQKQIQEKNDSLQNLVTEKDWLIKEIHHRVKNNFHTVIGLLGTQAQYLKTPEAIQAIANSQHRVHTMSLIHQKLYQSENFSLVNMPDYIYELVSYLKGYMDTSNRIRFDLQIERTDLDVGYALPLGLILNEGITNALKYAFPDDREGTIIISLKEKVNNEFTLIIADDGVGISSDLDFLKPISMGTNLIKGLSEDIGGTFTIERNQGTQIHISFMYEPDTTHYLTHLPAKKINEV
jgi:two-component sensor histidine kinase